jgi:Ser/Thr protein kinase RdoA (MazF antagonist)
VPLLLTVDNATQWLLERKLLTTADIVDGRVLIADAARRNRNLRVTRGTEPTAGYLIKQAGESGRDYTQTIRSEAAFYRFCDRDSLAAPLRTFVPGFVDYVESSGTLVIELLEHAVPIWTFWASGASDEVRTAAARNLGEALACLHATWRLPDDSARLPGPLSSDAPWILGVHRPRPSILERISAANLQALKILQSNPRVTDALDALRNSWMVSTVIHNDIKSDNVLVWQTPDGECQLRLVDWELVQAGDPAWDVAGVFTDIWMHWISGIPFGANRAPEEALADAHQQLSTLFAANRAFWSAYRKRALGDREAWTTLLERAVRYAAARLIQSAYEQAQDAPLLPNSSVAMLQVAANVLQDADTAQVHLLGIPPSLSFAALRS